jgi:nicotinamidase-related amidase
MCNHHTPYADPADPALPKSDITLDLQRTALVVIDPQIDFMSPEGRSWGVVGDSVTEQNLVPNLVRLFGAAQRAGVTVAISPQLGHDLAAMLPTRDVSSIAKCSAVAFVHEIVHSHSSQCSLRRPKMLTNGIPLEIPEDGIYEQRAQFKLLSP